jgi:hypothetical protein
MQGPVAFWMKATGPRFLLRVKLPAEGRRVVKVPQALPQHVAAAALPRNGAAAPAAITRPAIGETGGAKAAACSTASEAPATAQTARNNLRNFIY